MIKKLLVATIAASLFSCAGTSHIRTEMPHSMATNILVDNKYVEISDQCDFVFVSGHSVWISPNNTALLIAYYDPEPDSKIYQMTLGEKGKGCQNWLSQNLKDVIGLKIPNIDL